MKIDRRIPISAANYQAALDRAGNLTLAEYINAVLTQVLQPVALPASVPFSPLNHQNQNANTTTSP